MLDTAMHVYAVCYFAQLLLPMWRMLLYLLQYLFGECFSATSLIMY